MLELTDRELRVIGECLRAAVEGPFFVGHHQPPDPGAARSVDAFERGAGEDWGEFSRLLGLEPEAFIELAVRRWPACLESIDDDPARQVIDDTIKHLLACPPWCSDAWRERISVSRQTLSLIFDHWRHVAFAEVRRFSELPRWEPLLRAHDLHPEEISLEPLRRRVLWEMKPNRWKHGPSSLAMLPAHVRADRPVPADQPTLVLDAGGTNLRAALVRFDEARAPQISHLTRAPMPRGPMSAAAFYDALAERLAPIADQAQTLGFCFSYPAESSADGDARLLRWTKGVDVPEAVGQRIGEGLNAALEARGLGRKRITILNDTVACALAGHATDQPHDGLIGFILGTGTNVAYTEADGMLINVESGGFEDLWRGALDAEIDAESSNPGQQRLEKMISGVYLGPIALKLIRAGLEHLSEAGRAYFEGLVDLEWVEVNRFLGGEGPWMALPEADHALLLPLMMSLVERAARLSAAVIAAAAVKGEGGRDPARPVRLSVDGSTLLKTHGLAPRLRAHLDALLEPHGIHYAWVAVEEAPLIGAAIAGLSSLG